MRAVLRVALSATALAVCSELGALEPARLAGAEYAKDEFGRLVAVTTAQGTTRYSYFAGIKEPFLREVQLPNGTSEAFTLEVAGTTPSFFSPQSEPLSQSHNRFLFTGYEWQPEIKLYLTPSGRHYDPTFGRFVQQDSHLGDVVRPPSLHRYNYAHSNPTTFTDRSGHEAAIVTQASLDPKVRERLEQQSAATGYNAAWAGGAVMQMGVETAKAVDSLARFAIDERAQAELALRAAKSLKENAPTIVDALEGDLLARTELAAKAIEPRIEAYERGVDRYAATKDPVARGRIATEAVFPEASVVAFGAAGLARNFARAFVVREGTSLARTETASVLEPLATGAPALEQVPTAAAGELAPHAPKLLPGRTVLREYDIDRYGTFAATTRSGDQLAGHELLQNAWLREHGYVSTRGSGAPSRNNPAVALSKQMHDRIGLEQRRLGLFDRSRLSTMSADQNIALNAQAMRNAGVPEHVVQTLLKEASKHASGLP